MKRIDEATMISVTWSQKCRDLKHRDLSIFKMVLIFHQWKLVEFLILLICVVYFGEAKKHIKENDGKCWRAYLPV